MRLNLRSDLVVPVARGLTVGVTLNSAKSAVSLMRLILLTLRSALVVAALALAEAGGGLSIGLALLRIGVAALSLSKFSVKMLVLVFRFAGVRGVPGIVPDVALLGNLLAAASLSADIPNQFFFTVVFLISFQPRKKALTTASTPNPAAT